MWRAPIAPSDEHTQPMQRQTEYLNEQFMLLAAQSASVHERRRVLRERQRTHLALQILVIPHQEEVRPYPSSGSSEEPRSRFSHSSPSSPVAEHSPVLPTPPSPRRKSMLAKLKALVS